MQEKDAKIIAETSESGEPMIVFRAKDALATTVLHLYEGLAIEADCDDDFVDGIRARRREFAAWREEHPDEMRKPD